MKLIVHKKLAQKSMIGPFLVREAVLVALITTLIFIVLLNIRHYTQAFPLYPVVFTPSLLLMTLTIAKVHLVGEKLDFLSILSYYNQPKSFLGGPFQPKTCINSPTT